MMSKSPTVAATDLAPVDHATVAERVVARLRQEIIFGRLAEGQRLPAERDLAAQLGVNRLTLRAALARLVQMGLIVVRHGAGTIVAPWRETAGLETLTFLLEAGEPTQERWCDWLEDLLEIRRIIAAEAVALAAMRATDDDLQNVRDVIEQARACTADPVAFARMDVAIARAVVRASHNFGLELLLNALARFPDLQPALAKAMYPDPAAHMSHHDKVVALIVGRDAEVARTTVRRALDEQDAATLERVRRAVRSRAARRRGPNKTPA